MNAKSKTLIFFGSGPVAAQSLQDLAPHFTFAAVITKPPRINEKRAHNPVLDVAKEYGLKALLANNQVELDALFLDWQPTDALGLVIDYGVIMSKTVIERFEYGLINSHFSLLPEWRGADPITYALLSGQSITGVCLMLVSERLDEGNIIAQQIINIEPTDNNQSLSQKLIQASGRLLLKHLPFYINKQSKSTKQARALITYSRKISKNDGLLDWTKPATVLEREVRAFSNWPNSFTTIDGLNLIICHAQAVDQRLPVGKLYISRQNELLIGCRVGALQLLQLKPHNKKIMDAQAFINGYKNKFNFDWLK